MSLVGPDNERLYDDLNQMRSLPMFVACALTLLLLVAVILGYPRLQQRPLRFIFGFNIDSWLILFATKHLDQSQAHRKYMSKTACDLIDRSHVAPLHQHSDLCKTRSLDQTSWYCATHTP